MNPQKGKAFLYGMAVVWGILGLLMSFRESGGQLSGASIYILIVLAILVPITIIAFRKGRK
ncbi:hypothetical protein [Brevibacillus dissolubilis]|uniref:hypothetical protein n=1 Tax=Brevibacillus dissolubilis TaxID=1844116 RepID=UPI001115E15C|nr:hypothetical protein [Brevibacillus dissolubilis]